MLGFLSSFLGRAPEAKISRAAPLLAFANLGRPLWSERDTRVLAEAGFRRNPIVHRAVRLISETAASMPVTLFSGEEEIASHPLLDLLGKPNPRQAGETFLEALYVNLLVAGNCYIEQVPVGNAPGELYLLRPDRMQVVPGPEGWPEAYDYRVGSQSVRYRQEGPVPPILHLTQFDPLDDYYGLPPLSAAQVSLDVHNAASAWNKALLDNAARPSGALVYAADGSNMSDEQFQRLKDELESSFQGATNAGRPILLEGGLDWKPLSMTPKDMDFLEAKNTAAREIALAFGVPPLLLGLPGDNTLSNYAEANRAFWRTTILPLVGRTMRALAAWLGPAYGEPLRFEPDVDRVEALSDERAALWKRVSDAAFLTEDEKRTAVGYGPKVVADAQTLAGKLLEQRLEWERRFNPNHDPHNGQFTFGADSSANVGGRIQVAENDSSSRRRIDLLDEEAKGGHTVARHIGKSDEFLKARVLRSRTKIAIITAGERRAGSFSTLESANKLVNSTISDNLEKIDDFLAGGLFHILPDQYIYKEFNSVTGREAYVANDRSQPTIRDTFGVTVRLRRDYSKPGGFFVHSAWPRNDD